MGNGSGHTRSPTRSAAAWTCVAPRVVVAHQAGDLLAERDDAGAGERGEVDHGRGLVLGRERERVGEDEAPFGVGVEHFDRLAVADPEHVARSDRGAARHVLDQRDVTGDAASSRSSSRSADIAPITAAAPDMSLFIVSMPAFVLSESPPESKTTPLPTNASGLPRAPAGLYVSFRNRGVCVDPWPTPSTPPSFCWRSCATSSTCTVTPRATEEAPRFRRELGRRLGLRGLVDEVARPRHRVGDRRRRADRGAHLGAAVTDDDVTLASFVGLPSRLYSRNWYEPSTMPSATACAASADGEIRRHASRAWWPPTRPCGRGATTAAPARRRPSSVSSVELADTDEHRRLRLQLPGRGHRRASRPGCPRIPPRRGTRRAHRRARRRRRRRPDRGCARCRSSRSAPRAARRRRDRRVW